MCVLVEWEFSFDKCGSWSGCKFSKKRTQLYRCAEAKKKNKDCLRCNTLEEESQPGTTRSLKIKVRPQFTWMCPECRGEQNITIKEYMEAWRSASFLKAPKLEELVEKLVWAPTEEKRDEVWTAHLPQRMKD